MARYANRQSDEAQTFMIVQVRLLPASLRRPEDRDLRLEEEQTFSYFKPRDSSFTPIARRLGIGKPQWP